MNSQQLKKMHIMLFFGITFSFICGSVAADSSYSNTWAILIGVTNYQYMEDLLFPGNDVDDMRSVLIDSCGIPSSNIFIYKDSQATKNEIENAILQVSSISGNNDLVMFYFSGHGLGSGWLPDEAPYDESDGYEEMICPYDSLDYSLANDISDDELQTWLSLIDSKNTVCIIDTCGSGGMTKAGFRKNLTQSYLFESSLNTNQNDGFSSDFTRDVNGKKYLVLMAADDDEDSWDIYALQNGLFTYYLTQGLTDKDANTDNDQWISIEEAFYFARTATTNYKSSQHPQIMDGDMTTEIEISHLPTLPTPIITPTPTPTTTTPTPTPTTPSYTPTPMPTPTTTTPTPTPTLSPNHVDFTASPKSGTAPLTVRFQDTSQGNPTGWMWDINGDGFRDYSDEVFEHTYTSPGFYSVTLSITRGQELNTVTRTDYIHVTSPTPTTPPLNDLTINIHPGWNFISTPKTLAEGHRTANEIFHSVNSDGHSIYWYDANNQSWNRLKVQDEVEPLRGIWLYSVTSTQISLIFSNNQSQSWTVFLNQGWNAIGFTHMNSVPARDALLSLENRWYQLIGFDSESQLYENSLINGGLGIHGDMNLVYPGKGYWIFMNSQGSFT